MSTPGGRSITIPIKIEPNGQLAEVECGYVWHGLAVTRDHDGRGWRVTHTQSGLALGTHPTDPNRKARFNAVGAAIAAIAVVADLGDWNLELDPLLESFGGGTQEVSLEVFERMRLFVDPTL